MRNFLSILFAAILGGVIALGGAQLLNKEGKTITENENVPARVVKMTASNNNVSPSVPFDFKEAAKKSTKSVVHIAAKGSSSTASGGDDNIFKYFFGDEGSSHPISGTGSGVIYTSDGYIITNNHVVDFASDLEVTLSDNRKYAATLVGRNEKTDLAVIKIEANNLPTLDLADSDRAAIGEWTLAVGNPFNLTSTVTAGIISAKGRSLRLLPDRDAIESFIQTDAAVNPGNSGGALVDAQGRLLGINTAIATQNGSFQGYSFAIPINLVKRIADDIIKYGSYQRAFLGVNIFPLDNEVADEMGLEITQGVVINSLVDGGAAQYAGLLPKDVIVKVNDKTILSVPDLSETVGRTKVGDIIDIKINRFGKEMTVPVKMRPEPQN